MENLEETEYFKRTVAALDGYIFDGWGGHATCRICGASVRASSDRFYYGDRPPVVMHKEWHDEQERLRTSTST